jgi:hypothetical protein
LRDREVVQGGARGDRSFRAAAAPAASRSAESTATFAPPALCWWADAAARRGCGQSHTTLRPLGDDEFEFVSQTFSGEHHPFSGEHHPHPDLDLERDVELFCQVLIPALT